MVLTSEPTPVGISQRTAENHRNSIMKKTGSKSLPELARFALAAAWNSASERQAQRESPVTAVQDAVNS